jgi:urea transport system permease protein
MTNEGSAMHESAFLLGQVFNGFSVASLFILAALGLALSFGLMRVINMAHGEMLMLGGYLAYMTLQVVPGPLGILVAMPVAFLGAAFLGGILEWTVIHRLSARPLDTLLATWGVSLVLQQAARNLFGAIGVEVTAPTWLDHTVSIHSGFLSGLDLPDTRIFILIVAALVLGGIAALLNKTRLGLYVRAVNQDRPTAAAMGVNARRIDLLVFSLGTGVAGLAGVILALLGPVTPTVGQSYIVPAFLVVILGGLGSLVGTTIASIMVGLFTALVEIFVDVSVAQVLLLVFVILFIQIRPQGVITVRSRALEG